MTENWTLEQKIEALVRLPWTLTVEHNAGGYEVRVAELPDAIATGENEAAVGRDLYEAVWASLECRLTHDDPIPLPPGRSLPWLQRRSPARVNARTVRDIAVEEITVTTSGSAIAEPVAA